MVEYIIKAPPAERLSAAVAEALTEGMTQQQLMGVVLTTVATYTPPVPMSPADEADCEDFQAAGPDTIYTELPPGLIDLPSAAKKYSINRGTIRHWVKRGNVPSQGRLKGAARGGGYLLIREDDLLKYMVGPRDKGGRPSQALRTY